MVFNFIVISTRRYPLTIGYIIIQEIFFFFLIDKKQIYYKARKYKETQGRRFQIIHRKYTKRNPKG